MPARERSSSQRIVNQICIAKIPQPQAGNDRSVDFSTFYGMTQRSFPTLKTKSSHKPFSPSETEGEMDKIYFVQILRTAHLSEPLRSLPQTFPYGNASPLVRGGKNGFVQIFSERSRPFPRLNILFCVQIVGGGCGQPPEKSAENHGWGAESLRHGYRRATSLSQGRLSRPTAINLLYADFAGVEAKPLRDRLHFVQTCDSPLHSE